MKLPEHLTIKNFNNPTGTAVSTVPIIRDLTNRYNLVVSKTGISMKVYNDHKSIVFVVKVPSEKNFRYKKNIFYDVIVEFYPIASLDQEEDKSVREYGMRVYSNCPSFTYTFTHVYGKMNSLYRKIDQSMYSEKALKEPANIKNPYKLSGIEKTLWYALRYVQDKTGFNKKSIEGYIETVPANFKFPGNIFDGIVSQEGKIQEIHDTEMIKLKSRKSKAQSTTREFVIDGKTIGGREERSKSNKQGNLATTINNRLDDSKAIMQNRLSKDQSNKLDSKATNSSIFKSRLKK